MYVLGISCFYHDSAACIINDGIVIAAAQEERFTRKKHDTSFPVNAIKYCMEEAGITEKEIDYIGFYEKPMLKFERLLHQYIDTFPKSYLSFIKALPSWFSEKLNISSIIEEELGFKKDVLFIDHHLAHAASTYLMSPFKSASIITLDGVGEWATTTFAEGKGNDIIMKKEIHFPHSLGLLYNTATAYLGFTVNNDEYKVMGLSAYGKPTYYDEIRNMIKLRDDGSYRLDMSYFVYHYKMTMPSKKFINALGIPRTKGEKVEQRHMDIAASLQKVTEEAIMNMINGVYEETRNKNLCMAGGVALNSVANGKILRNSGFKNIFIQPAAGDDGTSLGAAAYVYNSILKKPRKYIMESAYLGPGFDTTYVENFLANGKINYTEFKNEKNLLKTVSKLIYDNNVIGWFQGRMEWGPRALGARSILANPCNNEMKDILNAKVKHREMFRPFAPAITIEDTNKYFESDNPVPMPADYMLMVYPIKKEKRKLLPAVTHVDGSGRLQTVRKNQNPLYYKLIKEFEKLSGVPILVNTSFNIRGEPIVCTPKDAYKCMMGTGIDYLVMGKFLIKRSDNPKDIWDSEKYADD